MKYLFGVIAAVALVFASSQEANAQVFRGRCGSYTTYSYPSYSYSYPTYYYSYSCYPSGGYYVRGCDGQLYYVYPSQSQPTYVAPKKEAPSFQDLPAPKTVPLKEPAVPATPKKEAPGFNDVPPPKSVEQPSAGSKPAVVRPPVITVPAPGFQDLPPKK